MKKNMKWCVLFTMCLSFLLLCSCENQQQENLGTEDETQSAGEKTQGVIEKGTTEDGVTYQYNKLTETLIVSGKIIKGPVNYMEERDEIPWGKWRDKAKKLVLEEGVECVTESAFMEFGRVEEVVFPNTLRKIDEYAFYDALTEVNRLKLPDSVEEIGRCAFGQSAFPQNAFCKGTEEIQLPKNLRRIGYAAFASQAMTSITIPENVEYIGDCVFESCHMLEKVIIKSKKLKELKKLEYTDEGILLHTNEDLAIYVPKGMEKKYEEILGVTGDRHVYPMKE